VKSAAVLDRPAEPPDLVVRYAAHSDGLIDVYLPRATPGSGEPKPFVVAVHGGFWRQAYDRTHLRPLAVALAERGFAVALPEYRRVGGQGRWPETAYDVQEALGALPQALPAEVTGLPCLAWPFVLMGHSAGGHLALWAGLRAGQQRVRRVLALAPVSDVRYAAQHAVGAGAVQALLGGDPTAVPENYEAADVLSLLPGDVPVTVVHGTADDAVPVAMSRRLARRAAGTAPAGSTLDYLELDGVDHFTLIDPESPVFTTLVRLLAPARSSP
jgi:acetyl esterase/lipase